MKVMMIGDVVSQAGSNFLREKLPAFKNQNKIDVCIANGENSAVGNGITPQSADFLFSSGVDIITTGNHVFKKREIYDYIESRKELIRPANYPGDCYGRGYYIYDGGRFSLLVINLMGTSFMEPLENPFYVADRLLKENKAKYTIVDFHAEATGEKKALGYYLDGRVSAVLGTHTHVQTADEQLLPKRTGFISDVGMTGPIHSALGVNPECVIKKLMTNLPTRFEVKEDDKCQLDAVILTLNETDGLCDKIERVNLR